MDNIKYYGSYDLETGKYTGFYPTDIWNDYNDIPTPNIELTKLEWKQARSRTTRFLVIDGVHTEVPFTSSELNDVELQNIRKERNQLLIESDWVVLSHSPVTGSKLDEWLEYRQKLRDVTKQEPPYTLPTKPS